ncbi:hypothetical protein [Microbacterium gorillae]|uniref:hypothetical protein n=1 Tax=Microbacterium gorillae TaxID=1231063 RepID=UPI003D98E33F
MSHSNPDETRAALTGTNETSRASVVLNGSGRVMRDAAVTSLAALEAGEWLADGFPRRQRKARRVHFFPQGEQLSVCMRAHTRPPRALRFDPETFTTEVDPVIGRPQHRTPCALCAILVADDSQALMLPVVPAIEGEIPVDTWFERDSAYPFRITRAMGTRDTVARFAVAEGVTSGAHLYRVTSLFTATALAIEFVRAIGAENAPTSEEVPAPCACCGQNSSSAAGDTCQACRNAAKYVHAWTYYEDSGINQEGFDDWARDVAWNSGNENHPSDEQRAAMEYLVRLFGTIIDHPWIGVAGHPDDPECAHRADGTDTTYCGEPERHHLWSTR